MNSGYMKDLLKDWKERAEKAEAELGRVQVAAAEMRKVLTFVDHLCCCEDPDWTDLDGDMVRHSLSSSAGTGYVRKEDVVPVLEAAAALAERAPKEPYPKEWDSDAVYRTHVPYCEVIALAKALAHAKAKGLLT